MAEGLRRNPDKQDNMSLDQDKKDIEPTDELGSIYRYMFLMSKPLGEIKHIINESMFGLFKRLAIMCETKPELGGIRDEFKRMHEAMSFFLKESEEIYERMYGSMSKLVKENEENDQNDQNDQ